MSEVKDEQMPTAPQSPPSLEGYQNLGFASIKNEVFDLRPDPSLVRPNFQNVPFLTEEEAKEALANYVSEHCCYDKGPANQLQFINLQSSNTFRYVLQTYTETRSTAYVSEPYSGQPIYITGRPPQPWEILVTPRIMFNNEVQKVEVPNTSHVENCTSCFGQGTKVCYFCQGRGTRRCTSCNGTGTDGHSNKNYGSFGQPAQTENGGNFGQPADGNNGNYGQSVHDHHHHDHHHHDHHHHDHHHVRCFKCSGTGIEGCLTCHRVGRVQCTSCRGSGKLKWFVQLTVEFKNNENDYLKKSESIPDDLIRDCQAQNIFTEQSHRVYPINHHTDPDINKASFELISSHLAKFSNCKILSQRQNIFVIPVTNCNYSWKNNAYKYQVYGLDLKVYSPDYPAKCCCTIL